MPPVLAVLVWIWALAGLVIFLVRRSRRRAAARGEVTEAPESIEATTPDATTVADLPPEEAPVPAGVGVAATPAPAPTPPPGFVAEPAPVVERQGRSAPAAGVADALVGIRMPCELVPLVVDRLATHQITLSTIGYAAEEVGTALADEVERLGYVVRPLSDREVIATRGATELRMTIHRPGLDGRHVEHPTARDDSVVVQISLS